MPDQEEINQQLRLLKTHRATLAHYLEQLATLGWAHVPPSVSAGIRDSRAEIRRIKSVLRKWGETVEDHPDDDPPSPDRASPVSTKPWVRSRTELRIAMGMGALIIIELVLLLFANMRDRTGNTVSNPTVAPAATTVPSIRPATPKPSATTSTQGDATTVVGDDQVLFRETFDGPRSSHFREHNDVTGTSKFIEGKYVTKLMVPNTRLDEPSVGNYADVSIEVEVSIEGPYTDTAGIFFGYQDFKNFYEFSVDSQGHYDLRRLLDQSGISLIDRTNISSDQINSSTERIRSPAIKVGQSNKLRVEMKGGMIRVYANDALLNEVSDNTFTNGQVRLIVSTRDEPNITVRYDNLIIRKAP